jgi:phosphate-selective porin OprO/OprP
MVALVSSTAAANAQDIVGPQTPDTMAYPAAATPGSPSYPVSSSYLVSENLRAEDAELSTRLADVEKALKKIDEKAKADKKKAASTMSATPGGRIFIDTATFSQDPIDKLRWDEQNGIEFRAARIFVEGKGFDVIKYKIEWDFAGRDKARAKDIYIAITDLPWLQNVQVGHFKEPFSLDELTSARFITFMERTVGNDVITPKRHLGIMAHGATELERATYAIGAFAEKDDDGGVIQDDVMGGAVTMRGTWLPWYDEATEGRGLIHTGIAYSYRDPFKNTYAMKYRPECHLAHEEALTLTDVSNRNMLDLELAMVYGPFSFQSEYYYTSINRTAHADTNAQSAYAYVSYFLTGENRVYDRSRGYFTRVKPNENFFRVRDEGGNTHTGKGAWELKYRYSWFNGYDGDLLGWDYVGDHTFGVNWYLNPYTRCMLEYIHSGINQNAGLGVGDLDIFQMRAQIDF